MADVQWIKIAIDIFDNRKIKRIRRQYKEEWPQIVLSWLMLLTLAGSINDDGMVYDAVDTIPHTPDSLADEFCLPADIMQTAIEEFEKLHMIEYVDGIIRIANWEKYQNVDGMDRIKEQTRKRVAKCRERKKESIDSECNVTCNVTVTQCNATEGEEEKEKNKKENRECVYTVTPTPEPTYSDLCKKYGTAFVDERMHRAERYAGTTMFTVAKWCEEDFGSRSKRKKTGFANIEQHPYDMQTLEAQLMANGKKEG